MFYSYRLGSASAVGIACHLGVLIWRREGHDMGGGFVFAVSPWLVIPVLLLLVLGGVKLVKLLLIALKG